MTNAQMTIARINSALGCDCTKEEPNSFKMLKELVAELLPGWSLVPNIGTEVKADHPITVLNPEEYFMVEGIKAETTWPGSTNSPFCVIGENTCWHGLRGITPKPKDK